MALDLDTSRQLRSLSELADLVEAIATAPSTESEPDWVEWKSEADLTDRKWQARIAKLIAGFANRNPAVAKLQAGGCGYLVIGVEPGTVAGITPVDNAILHDGVSRYIGTAPRWSPRYVAHTGQQVLVITIEPPEFGDRITSILREYTDQTGTSECRAGDVPVRRSGKTVHASQADYDMLTERFAASQAQASSGLTVEAIETVVAIPVAWGTNETEMWLRQQRTTLLTPLQRRMDDSLDPLVSRALLGVSDGRRPEQYVEEVESYLADAAALLPDMARAVALKNRTPGMRLAVVNQTEHNFAAVEVEVSLDGDLWAFQDEDDARPEMPDVPRQGGSRTVDGL